MTLILLHGAMGSKRQFRKLEPLLANGFTTHAFNFQGHGERPLEAEAFSTQVFAADVLAEMEALNLERADFLGYSIYVAVYQAMHHPERVGHIFTLATKYHWTVAARGLGAAR